MNEKVKYLIVGFVLGAVTAWLFTLITLNYSNKSSDFDIRSGMMGSSIEADLVDRHFIEQMIPHHVDAVEMSELALGRAQSEEVKELAQNIITSQSTEINQMKTWYRQWFGSEYTEAEDDFRMGPGLMRGRMGMMGGNIDFEALQSAEDFDSAFAKEMIPHHQMAIMMATMLERSTNRPEMKQLASDIIKTQTSEIILMREWLKKWEE
jgi:uncharacterized protein (DUF305 family)